MKTPPVEGYRRTTVKHPVRVPTLDGKGVAETVDIDVDAWKNAAGEVLFDSEARARIEDVKARYMGLLSPAEIKDIRVSKLNATQAQLSSWLQLGGKTWTRWESGRERPSRSMNVLLCALRDGKVNTDYLETLKFGRTLGQAWSGEPALPTKELVVYQPVRRARDREYLLKSVDFALRSWDEDAALYLIEAKSTLKHRAHFHWDASAVFHFVTSAKTRWRWGNPWSVSTQPRGSEELQTGRSQARVSPIELIAS